MSQGKKNWWNGGRNVPKETEVGSALGMCQIKQRMAARLACAKGKLDSMTLGICHRKKEDGSAIKMCQRKQRTAATGGERQTRDVPRGKLYGVMPAM